MPRGELRHLADRARMGTASLLRLICLGGHYFRFRSAMIGKFWRGFVLCHVYSQVVRLGKGITIIRLYRIRKSTGEMRMMLGPAGPSYFPSEGTDRLKPRG